MKRPFGGPEFVLQYLGRYTHRVAISNHRLVSFVDGQVTTSSYAASCCIFFRKGLCVSCSSVFSPADGAPQHCSLCFQLLGAAQEALSQEHIPSTEDAPDLYRCPKCGGPMKVIERLTAAEIQLRSPPRIISAA